MTNRPRKNLPKDKYDKPMLKKRIDTAMAAYLSSGKTVQQWVPELVSEDAHHPRSRQRD